MSLSLISDAYAQSAPAAAAGFDFMSLLPLVAIFVVFYFFLIRPQQKKAQHQKDMVNSLRRGDSIVTAGGLIGSISKVVNDQEIEVEIADGVKVKVARAMVVNVVSKSHPVAEKADPSEKKESVEARVTKAAAKPKAKVKTAAPKKAAVKAKAKAPANKK